MNLVMILLPAVISIVSSNDSEPPEGAGTLHPLAVIAGGPAIVEGMETTILSPMEAAGIAADLLHAMGATGVLVCEVHRIEAPLTAYIVDALGAMDMIFLSDTTGDGEVQYSTFRMVLRDGAESDGELYAPGEQISFIARGVDSTGQIVWYPPCGPDFVVPEGDPGITDEMLEYEFLLWREDFESLESRYPRPEPEDTDE